LRSEIVGGERFLQAPEPLQNIASVELRVCVGRAAPRRLFISSKRFFMTAELLQD
jgi:hypothetical protein